MGPVQAAQWAQQPFPAQAQTLTFPVQGPLQVAQVLPGGQPVIWSQANIFPATQQQWAAMAAYMPAQTVGVGGHAIPAAMLQGLVPITTMCPQACDLSAPSSAITSPQHTADPTLLQRQLSLGREGLSVDSDAGEGPSTSGAIAAGVGPGVASAVVSRCGTPGLMSVPDTLACSQLLPPSAAVNQEEEGSCSDLDLSRMTLSPGTSTSPSTESRKFSQCTFKNTMSNFMSFNYCHKYLYKHSSFCTVRISINSILIFQYLIYITAYYKQSNSSASSLGYFAGHLKHKLAKISMLTEH